MPGLLQYPAVGCVVEFFDAGSIHIGVVTDASGDKLRLMLPNRRETKLSAARTLPWAGPLIPGYASLSKDGVVKFLEASRAKREAVAKDVNVEEVWELAQGEVPIAPASWFAELFESDPDADTIVGYARALLGAKTRFHFDSPNFEVLSAEMVERKQAEMARQRERERLVSEGCPFVRLLWDVANRKATCPAPGTSGYPSDEIARRLEAMLYAHMIDPETSEEDALWKMMTKGLGEIPFLAVQLLEAWGKVAPHHNFWLDKAAYKPGNDWWRPFADEVDAYVKSAMEAPLPESDLPFVSVDGESTKDIDDSYFIEAREGGGWRLSMAFACPALCWPFGSKLDRDVLHRGTSIYLPEGDCHMLPEELGTSSFSLLEGQRRPALIIAQDVAADGSLEGDPSFEVKFVCLAANLRYGACQALIEGRDDEAGRALEFKEQVLLGEALARARQKRRVQEGAVVFLRDDPSLKLHGEGADVQVELVPEENRRDALQMVAEMMILGGALAANWAVKNSVPMLFRTQDVVIPKEYAGVWERPEEIAPILHCLAASVLSPQPRQHAALGLCRYATVTSPLRRYADLVNEAQLLSCIMDGAPRFGEADLTSILLLLNASLDLAGQVQRNRTRYWKLLYFKQQGDKVWWHGVVAEENELFVLVSLKKENINLRGKRNLFDEKVVPGMPVAVRIGKVNPLYGDIHIIEAAPDESFGDDEALFPLD